jgi:hypothetical protein
MDPQLLEAIAAVVTAVISLIGFPLIFSQLRSMKAAIQSDTLQSLYGRMDSIHTVFLSKPGLRPYFYANKSPGDLPPGITRDELEAAAEMLADFFQHIWLQQHLMPEAVAEGCITYMQQIHESSPVLQQFLRDNEKWYDGRFVARCRSELVPGSKQLLGSGDVLPPRR